MDTMVITEAQLTAMPRMSSAVRSRLRVRFRSAIPSMSMSVHGQMSLKQLKNSGVKLVSIMGNESSSVLEHDEVTHPPPTAFQEPLSLQLIEETGHLYFCETGALYYSALHDRAIRLGD